MNHSPAYVIGQYLKDQGTVVAPGDSGDWPCYVAALPDGDQVENDCLAVIDTPGIKDGRIMSGGPLFHQGFQILLRSQIYNAGYAQADLIASVFAAVDNISLDVSTSTYTLLSIVQTSSVLGLGHEPDSTKRRWLFSTNYMTTIKET